MRDNLKEIVEALIFISVEPLTPAKIKAVLEDATEDEIKQAVEELRAFYEAGDRGIRLVSTAGGWQFATKSAFDPQVRRLLQIERKSRLSRAGLETLSIIAYHQPVTQAEINALRGVSDSTFTLHTLLQKKLIKISGRKKAPGNPLLYKTSEDFLIYFGLNDLGELPSQEEIAKILEQENNSES
jgi:segregation and condensation protein B